MQRQFTSGSRQAPDPFDQFLEENQFYRKHTARDSSCLFRVISEQLYDTQLHHLVIRKKCVLYMRKHHQFFQPLVERDLDEYLDDMSKPKTFGTLIELQAAGYLFQRNVLLFEPFNLGNYYVSRPYFQEVFRIFYTPERHFDTVFTSEYIMDAAICQSICYEILYKDLYKLPDVSYAVEYMLHANTFDSADIRKDVNERGYTKCIHLPDGRVFELDTPVGTNCILENYKLCHFHYSNFPRFSDELQRELKVYSREQYDKNILNKTAESLLPQKYMSCVRQLLEEGITPFPYKVAKALDPNMYRNIEFDAWNEARKEMKLQNWYNGDTNFKVGAKCHVQLRKSENNLYTCHIQEIDFDKRYCIVFLEQLGEKRKVPYDSLTPLPPEQFKPWTVPYRFQRHMHNYSSFRFTRHYNYRLKFNEQYSATHHQYCAPLGELKGAEYCELSEDVYEGKQHLAGCYYKLKQFTHLDNFHTHTVEYCTMPLTIDQQRDIDCKPGTGQRSGGGATSHDGGNSRVSSRASNQTGNGADTVNNYRGGENGGSDDNSTLNMGGEGCEISEQDVVCGNVGGGGSNGGGYVEYPNFYPLQQYVGAAPEDYYGYSYEGTMYQPTTIVPAAANNGTFYYMYNSMAAPTYPQAANNIYMQPGQPIQGPPSLITTAPPNMTLPNGGATSYYTNPYYSTPMAAVPTPTATNPPTNLTTTTYNGGGSGNSTASASVTPSSRPRPFNPHSTPLSGRVNWEARKSFKASGIDLPTDLATLRYFYNLGLDCHHRHYKQRTHHNTDGGDGSSIADSKECINKLTVDLSNIKIEDNGNKSEPTPDPNNNVTMIPTGNFTKPTFSQRRYTSRFYNGNKNYHRNSNASGNNTKTDYNKNNTGVKSTTYTTPNSSRSNPNSANSTNSATGTNVLPSPHVEHGGQTTPLLSFNNVNLSADNMQTTPTAPGTYNQTPHNTLHTYSAPYEYGQADASSTPQLTVVPPPQPPPPQQGATVGPGSAGVYVQMPLPPGPFGLYPGHGPPGPPPQMGLNAAMNSAQVGGPYAAYMGPPQMGPIPGLQVPPPPIAHGMAGANGYYGTPNGTESNDNGLKSDAIGAATHFHCMNYPPPLPFYYPPNGGVVANGTIAGNNLGTVSGTTGN